MHDYFTLKAVRSKDLRRISRYFKTSKEQVSDFVNFRKEGNQLCVHDRYKSGKLNSDKNSVVLYHCEINTPQLARC